MALITPAEVISSALTNANFDTYLVKSSFIEIAELNFIKPALGERLYEDVVDDVENSVIGAYGFVATVVEGSNELTPNIILVSSTYSGIAVGDFVKGDGIPTYEDDNSSGGDCHRGLTKITELNTDATGNIHSMKISGTPKVSNATSNIVVSKPFSILHEGYIKKYLAFCVKFEMLPDMSYNTTSQGVVENFGESTMPVDAKKLSFLRNETFKKSDTYLRRMVEFLSENNKSFPNWVNEAEGGVSKRNGIILY